MTTETTWTYDDTVSSMIMCIADDEDPARAAVRLAAVAIVLAARETRPHDLAMRRIARSLESAGWLAERLTAKLSTMEGIDELANGLDMRLLFDGPPP